MPFDKKEWSKEYYEKNKEKLRKYDKEYRENNKEFYKEYMKEYNKEYKKEYFQTEQGKKSNRINTWKRSGVICDDFDELYDLYISIWNCEECDVELVEGNKAYNRKCLDHDHQTGEFRNVLCHNCNIKRR